MSRARPEPAPASELEIMKATLAAGGRVGFGGEDGSPNWTAPLMLRQDRGAFIADRIDGTHLGTFASLEAALEAIQADILGPTR